ncbi:hypothetical protein OAV62_01660 [bacterium]|nr:hypothetical protein [bacterium]
MSNNLFIYDWSTSATDTHTIIRIFGLTPESKSCCLIIKNFLPRIFIELPTNVQWTSGKIGVLEKYLHNSRIFWDSPVGRAKVKRRKLYYAKFDPKTNQPIKYPFLMYTFNSSRSFYDIAQKLRKSLIIPGIGKVKLTAHESNIAIETQMICSRDILSAGWIQYTGRPVANASKVTYCDEEYEVDVDDISKTDFSAHISPTILSFDIETNSANPNVIPSPKNPHDCIFQISCVYWNTQLKLYSEYLLTLGNPDHDDVGKDVIVLSFDHELHLINSFVKLLLEWNPCVITGYNIFGFDLPYLIDRSDHNRSKTRFCKIGMIQGKMCEDKETRSKQGMEQRFLMTDGRLWVDLMHMVKRDFKLANYKLDTVAKHFLDAKKDPVSYKDIFRSYREGVDNPTEEGVKLLAVVGRYCVKDAVLVKDLFEKLDVWVGLIEMAAVCVVAPSTVFTRGQQSKVFAQVYHHCYTHNIVIDNTKEMKFEEMEFTGATVIPPIPGIYDNVVPFDFASLYPSLIIAYNIDYSTLVPDDLKISDEECHVIKWDEHVHCEHCAEDYNPTSKKYRCQSYFFRFLKNPPGVLPTILKNLLGLRKETRTKMKILNDSLKTLPTPQHHDTKLLVGILDKRQLSYKIASNSIYGALGVKPKKAVLPFMAGAMSITAMGRMNLDKAAKHMQKKYDAHLVYGDSVPGNTPILVRYFNGLINIGKIEDLCTDWEPYRQFKRDDKTLTYKQQAEIEMEVWSNGRWSSIRRVIRHKTRKRLYTVQSRKGVVTVTEDHSLLNQKGDLLKPHESMGESLLWSFPKNCEPPIHYPEAFTLATAHFYGLIFAYGKFVANELRIYCPPADMCAVLEGRRGRFLLKGDYISNDDPYFLSEIRLLFRAHGEFSTVPFAVLNSRLDARKAFFVGMGGESVDFTTPHPIVAQTFWYLCRSIGMNMGVSWNNPNYTVCEVEESSSKVVGIYKHPEIVTEFVYDIETSSGKFHAGVGDLIVKNTDSTYLQFPKIEEPVQLWEYSRQIEKELEVDKIFPKPMKLEFEDAIYADFLILKKKKYMWKDLDEAGIIGDEIGKKGVLTVRRDNSECLRAIYEDLVKSIFDRIPEEDVMYYITRYVVDCLSHRHPQSYFIVTKSVKDVGDYKVRALSTDPKKRATRLKELACTLEEYPLRALPAHVQLSVKMRSRGVRVDASQRIEYVIVHAPGRTDKLFDKLEDCEYQAKYSSVVKIDYLRYIDQFCPQLDQLLKVRFKRDKIFTKQYKIFVTYTKVLMELEKLVRPCITFTGDVDETQSNRIPPF